MVKNNQVEKGDRISLHIDGNITLGGLFPVHRRSGTTENACGDIDLLPGYQYLASMLYALEEINDSPDILPGIALGAKIYDTCRSQTIGSEGAKEIIKYTLRDENGIAPLAGVVGPFRSDVSVAVANLLRVFNIPQVSYGSTTPVLSNKDLYGYFLRTVPSNSYQGKAMVDVVRHFGWSYVMTVYSPGEYGERGMVKFYEEAERAGICIANKKKLPSFPTEEDFDKTIQELLEIRKKNFRGKLDAVVLFCIQRDNQGLVRAAQKVLENGERFYWLASNAWGDRKQVTEGADEAGEGAITMNYIEGEVDSFKKKFLNMIPSLNKYGRWFEEFYQETLKCKLKNSSKPLDYQQECSTNKSLPQDLEIGPVRVVINAVYAMAHALNNMHLTLCAGQRGLCSDMQNLKREQFLNFLKNVSFPDASLDFNVTFNQNGDVDGNYNVLNFKKVEGRHRHVIIGNWSGALNEDGNIQGNIRLDDDEIVWGGGKTTTPLSYCSKACPARKITIPEITNARCCWRCKGCRSNDIIMNNTCSLCGKGKIPDTNMTRCLKLPVVFPTWNDTPAQVLTGFISAGLIASIATAVIFIMQRKNRIVKASGRELSVILFLGVILCYIAALLHFVKPQATICGAKRFTDSVSMTACYAPVLLRTNRIYRIFKAAQKSVRRPTMISPLSQTFVALGIIATQCLITMIWVLSKPPLSVEYYGYKDRVILECSTDDFSVAINLCFNVILMFISTVYAFQTRNFPRNFNEAKYIGVTMYISCSVWVVFLPCYLNAADSIWKSYFLCSSLFLIGTVTLLGLLVPKVLLVYFGNVVEPSGESTLTCTMDDKSKSEHRRDTMTMGS
ncbi:Metabotropic glutamate receptor 8 [Stylophora pistillata]|uniref:Metabotropic glutamate receptor 8 n=1 Tax=Stylophora pistillata TaxID=50429 RepID=A0A2B4SKW8_STYPI|nr:Metabotropic glutamate receptor 8 [Stylophora pistillata]